MSYEFRYRALAEALYDALTEDAFYTAMEASVEGNSSARRRAMLRYYDYSIQEASRYGDLLVADAPAAGASIWTAPMDTDRARRMADAKKAFLGTHMGVASRDTYLEITRSMARQTRTVVSPHSWYLSIVGVAPRYQGRGVGGRLVRPVLDRTDVRGGPVYLETFTPRNMRFYRRFGFREAGAFEAPAAKARYWVMVREPSGSLDGPGFEATQTDIQEETDAETR